jgi:hypothetical protein
VLLSLLAFLILFQVLLGPLALTAFLVHDPENGEEAGSGDVDDVLVEFEDEAAVGDDLPSLLEGLVEVGLLLQLDPPVVQRVRVQRREAVLPAVLAFVVHHVVVVADRMHVYERALTNPANPRPVLKTHGVRFATRALHQLIIILYSFISNYPSFLSAQENS